MHNENYFARKGGPEGERDEEKICLVTRFNVQFTPLTTRNQFRRKLTDLFNKNCDQQLMFCL